MNDLDNQQAYWDRQGLAKTFCHPLDLDRLRGLVPPEGRILDYGCGYGRAMDLLFRSGYRNVVGVDASARQMEKGRSLHPHLSFVRIDPPKTPFPDETFDAVLLIAVLTCIPGDRAQQAVLDELYRVIRPGGLLCIGDYWIQSDPRNRDRYERFRNAHGVYGVFELPEGVVLRHHAPEWIDALTSRWERIALQDLQVTTMNGHPSVGFQWLGRKP